MAVLLITHKYNPQTSKADYVGLYNVIRSYRWKRISDSNWAINTEEPPKAVGQKLQRYIDPNTFGNATPRKSRVRELARS